MESKNMVYNLTLYKNGKLTPRGRNLKKTFCSFETCKDYLYEYPSKIIKFLTEKADYNKDNLHIFADHDIAQPSLSQYSLYRIVIKHINNNQTYDLINFLIKISAEDIFDFDPWRRNTTNSVWVKNFDPMGSIENYWGATTGVNTENYTIYPLSMEE